MKKKILIGALGFASVFMMSSATDGDGSENERRFFGSQITGVASCTPTTPFPDGSPRFIKVWEVEYYVFWMGVQTSESSPIYSSHCDMP